MLLMLLGKLLAFAMTNNTSRLVETVHSLHRKNII